MAFSIKEGEYVLSGGFFESFITHQSLVAGNNKKWSLWKRLPFLPEGVMPT
ncbi:MAG: hypothetical protein WAL98_14755 [Desulfatiglandaceae bacterium]|jgi:hypothetical protein